MRTGQGGGQRGADCPPHPWIWETSKIRADGMGNSGIQGTEFF